MDPRVRSVAKKHAMSLPVFAPGCGAWVQMYLLGEFQLSGNLVKTNKQTKNLVLVISFTVSMK